METKVIAYEDGEYNVEIVVRKARLIDGIRRTVLIAQERAAMLAAYGIKSKGDDDAAESEELRTAMPEGAESYLWVYRMHTYSPCIAATVEIRNLEGAGMKLSKDISPEEFLELPEALVLLWENGTLEINSHWALRIPKKAEVGETPEEAGEENEPADSSSSDKS